MTPSQFRKQFPSLERLVHANNCSRGAPARQVLAAMDRYRDSWMSRLSPWDEWAAEWERSRAAFARLVGARPSSIALMTSVTQALAVALHSVIPLREGALVVEQENFPTVHHLARALAHKGVEVRTTRPRTTPGDSGPLAEALTAGPVAAVVHTHLSYLDGTIFPVETAVAQSQEAGALAIVDGYQALGIVPTDVNELAADFYTSGSHKYLLGMEGLAFLYAKPATTDSLAPAMPGWFAARDLMAMDPHDELTGDVRRFEAGTPPVSLTYPTNAALELLERVPVQLRLDHVREIVRELRATAAAAGIAVATPDARVHQGPLLSLRLARAEDAVASLAAAGIIASARGDHLRLSFHYYNDESDVERIGEWIAERGWEFANPAGEATK